MAQLAHTQSQVIPANTRTRRVIGGAILALLVAGAVVLALTLPGNDSSSVTSENQSPAIAPSARFDGGPNEGTRGALSAQRVDSPVIRFDGGPQEGTRGAIARSNPVQAPTAARASTAARRRARAARSLSTAPPRGSTAAPTREAAARADELPSPDGKGPDSGPFPRPEPVDDQGIERVERSDRPSARARARSAQTPMPSSS